MKMSSLFANAKVGLIFYVSTAGCNAYVPAGNTVYGDNRFIGIFPSESGMIEISLKEKGDYVNLVTGDEYKNTDKIFINASKTTPVFLIKNSM